MNKNKNINIKINISKNNLQDIQNIIAKYHYNFINEIANNQKQIANTNYKKHNAKIEYKTLYKDGQPTNYNKIKITCKRIKNQKNFIEIIKHVFYFYELETFAKDIYKFINYEMQKSKKAYNK